MIGATNPQASAPGTIRGDYCIEVGRNVIHGSDSVENAQKEIALWFGGALRMCMCPAVRSFEAAAVATDCTDCQRMPCCQYTVDCSLSLLVTRFNTRQYQ